MQRGEGPDDAFRLPEVPGVAVLPRRAEGRKCARSWKISPMVGADLGIMKRDAERMRGQRPFVFANMKTGEGLAEIAAFVERRGGLAG